MSVKYLGNELWEGVAARLQRHGYKKKGAVLVRQSGTLEERFHIEGSRWNSGVEPYLFRLGISMRLIDLSLPVRIEGVLLTDHTEVKKWGHSSGRQRCVDPDAPEWFAVTKEGLDQMIMSLTEQITRVSDVLRECEPIVREVAIQGEYIPLWRAIERSRQF
ncbi:hypothetical protein [Noviherbaspirillum galbum]|uniref:DUF4304 domain-containing protein n=1 Tax=Noviherbaspirillum galbum TaxID=2709383 RepID=A0A6B3SW39_9BURK|nr:hypothetical protein [Noviherbaspirillum galbum]NEX63136.1 hypothetical protein [Noviherbaspirillum galbum]